MVASPAVMGRTTSTSAMAGAGLKKWMPQTRSGRPVAMAISTTGSVEVLVARIVSRLADAVELGEEVLLHAEVLDHRLDDQVDVDQLAQVRGGRSPGPRDLRGSASVRLPFSTCLASDFSRPASMASALAWLRLRSTTSIARWRPPPRRCPSP